MRQAVDALNERWLSIATLVPMPPSKVKTDQMYDDRLIQMLQVLRTGIEVDVRELIVQRESTDPAHTTELRPRIYELLQNYTVDESLVDPARA